MVWCSEISPQILRKRHDGHGTFKAFIKAWHGGFSNVSVISDDFVPLFPCVFYSFAVPHFLKFGSDACLIFFWWFSRNVSGKMKLAPLPWNLRKYLTDGILNTFMSIRSNHQKPLETTFFQFLEKGIPSFFGFVVIYFKSEYFTVSFLICTVSDHKRFGNNSVFFPDLEVGCIHY